MRTAVLITNPLSRTYSLWAVHRFGGQLEKRGFAVQCFELTKNQRVGDIIALLDPESTDLLALVAGDGTINSALNALALRDDRERFRVAIVPAGTANLLSKELRTNSQRKSLGAIDSGRMKRLHMGKVTTLGETGETTRYFALMASAGFDSRAVSQVSEKLKSRLGGFAYIYEFFKIVTGGNFGELETVVEGEMYRGVMVCVSNGRYYGVKIPTTSSSLEDSCFDLLILRRISIPSLIHYMFTKKNNRNITKLTGKNCVTIATTAKNYPLQVDGDHCCTLPVRVESTGVYINVYCL
ncbi:MAG: hypothetical protein LBU15_03135 [Rickettsiales bacterium]|jgi:diacylglycerol kinase family enzyme|nr:hypothetical protein [Rickettsiales bacterium]